MNLNVMFKSTNKSCRYELKCEWVFFLNTVYIYIQHKNVSVYRPTADA